MEAAGLVGGVIATWKTCVQIFDIVDQSKRYGRDFELYRVKLEVERLRLLAWGDSMGLNEDPKEGRRAKPDSRLQEERTKQVVLQVLGSIEQIFEDSDRLRSRYGLTEEVARSDARASLPSLLKKAGATFRRSGKDRQKTATLKQKTVWVVRDRTEFLLMVTEIRLLNDSLADMFPDLSIREALRREIRRTKEISSLVLLQEAATESLDVSDIVSEQLEEMTVSYRSGTRDDTVTATSTSTDGNGSKKIFPSKRKSYAASREPTTLQAIAGDEAALDALEKRMEVIDVIEAKLSKGALEVSLIGPQVWSSRTTAYIGWRGVEEDEFRTLKFSDRGFAKASHASFEAYRKRKFLKKRVKNKYGDEDDDEDSAALDPEASPRYENINAGTVTVEGFALECWVYEDEYGIRRENTIMVSMSNPPSITAERLLRRLSELQIRADRLGYNSGQDDLDLHDFVSDDRIWYVSRTAYKESDSTSNLYSTLNRSDLYVNFNTGLAITREWSDPKSVWNLLWQIILGKELERRMRNYPDAWISGFTPRILATLIISDLWIRNVEVIRRPIIVPLTLKKKPNTAEEAAEAADFQKRGDVALENHKYQEAEDLYTKAFEIGGTNAVYLCKRSDASFSLSKYAEAVYDASIATQFDPKLVEGWVRLGAAQGKLNNLNQTVEAYNTAVQLAGLSVTPAITSSLEEARAKVRTFNKDVDAEKDSKKRHKMVVDQMDKKWSILTADIKFHSLVHERQVDGLRFFAEKMRWPYLNEVRDIAEEVYASIHNGTPINYHVADWFYGLSLPGSQFAAKVMGALIHCSPSLLKEITYCYQSNIILSKQTYWRSTSVLGRVLGALPNVKSLCGWLGPCPSVELDPPDKMPLAARLKARALPPIKPVVDNGRNEIVIRRRSNSYQYTAPAHHEDLTAYIADMTTEDAYIAPQPPVESMTTVTLKSIKLKKVPSDVLNEMPAISGAYQNLEYRASLSFSIDNGANEVTYSLYTNPIFVTLPVCYGGPHRVHRRAIKRYQPIQFDVEMLEDRIPDDEEDQEACMLINATGRGAEILARAWCCERGKHAIIVRENSTCLVCAFNSAESLEIGVVIWV
ncbi:hypothetical protein LTR64_008386 [Lithohypha guttulata]|uniref:uncharacterized protein n=1 Tax=Lithohypha guttulata TaxID=1690604 RepID=UPI002DE0F64A|nr:hypothetical protein LTR51_008568 [Lithohypha guttulata]